MPIVLLTRNPYHVWGNIIIVNMVWWNKLRFQDPLCADGHRMAIVHQHLNRNQGLVCSSAPRLLNGERSEIPHRCQQVSLSSGDSFCHQESGYLLYSHSGPAIHLGAFHITCGLSQNACDREAVVIITAWGEGAPSSILMVHSTIAYSMSTALCGSSPGGVISSSLDPDLLLV